MRVVRRGCGAGVGDADPRLLRIVTISPEVTRSAAPAMISRRGRLAPVGRWPVPGAAPLRHRPRLAFPANPGTTRRARAAAVPEARCRSDRRVRHRPALPGAAAPPAPSDGRYSSASSHTCPQYSQVNAALAIALVQPSHRFQVMCLDRGGKRCTTGSTHIYRGELDYGAVGALRAPADPGPE